MTETGQKRALMTLLISSHSAMQKALPIPDIGGILHLLSRYVAECKTQYFPSSKRPTSRLGVKTMAAIGFIVFAVTGIFLGLLADAQRQHFGVFSGNLLLGAEVAVLVVGGLAASFWRKGKRSLSISLASWGAAAFFAFVAWFVHPEQVISRAGERLSDWELAIDNYRIEQAYGEKDKDALVRFQRLATELSARRNEYEAALTRYKGDPEFFRSSFFTWILGAIAVVFAIAGFVMFKRLGPYVRQL